MATGKKTKQPEQTKNEKNQFTKFKESDISNSDMNKYSCYVFHFPVCPRPPALSIFTLLLLSITISFLNLSLKSLTSLSKNSNLLRVFFMSILLFILDNFFWKIDFIDLFFSILYLANFKISFLLVNNIFSWFFVKYGFSFRFEFIFLR